MAKITILLILTTGYTLFLLNRYDNIASPFGNLDNIGFSTLIPDDSSIEIDIRINDPNDPPGSSGIDCTKEFINFDTHNQYIIVLLQYSCSVRLSIYDSINDVVTLSIIGNIVDFLITDNGMLILPNKPRSQVYIWKDFTSPNSYSIVDFEYPIDKNTMKYHQLTDSIFYINSDNRALIQYKIDLNESIEIDKIKLFSYDIQKNSKVIAFRPEDWDNRNQIIISDLDSNWTFVIDNDVTINRLGWLPNTNRLLATATQLEELILFDLVDNETLNEMGRIKGEPKSTLSGIQQQFSIDPAVKYLALSTSRSTIINNNGDTSYVLKLELIDIDSFLIKEVLFNESKSTYIFIKGVKWVSEKEIMMVKTNEIIRIMVN